MDKKQPKFEPAIIKPISVERFECLLEICETLNKHNLPVFAKVEIIERILNELRPQVEAEYQRDLALFNAQNNKEV